MSSLPFSKYSGNGNDFIILDHPSIEVTSALIQKLCDRHFGVGADGLMILKDVPHADGRMLIYNADGGEAEMCGNGLRCLVTYLDDKLGREKDTYHIQTMNALYPVSRKGQSFAIEMAEIKDRNLFDLTFFKDFKNKFFINTGVPHLIFESQDVKKIDIKKVAAFYRYHPLFPKGTNVSFVQVLDQKNQIAYVRTYERGVEDETYSCGTGLTATGLALSHWFGWIGDIKLQTLGGNQNVSMGERIFYSGEVYFCFKGEIKV